MHSKAQRFYAGLLLAGLTLALPGCKRRPIQVYDVPKESSSATARANPKTPEGWTEQPASGMRVASFVVTGKGGRRAEVAVIPMQGLVGRDLEMVNMWRNEVGLQPLSAEGLPSAGESVPIGPLTGRLYDLAGAKASPNQPGRLLAAMANRGDTSWFFKMSGDSALVEQQKNVFKDFLKNYDFSQTAPPEPQFASNPHALSANAGRIPSAGNAEHPQWTVPAGWQEQPAGGMRVGSFAATGPEGEAEISVFAFGGMAGGVLGNVNRWRRQLGLGPISEADLPKYTQALDAVGANAVLVDISGANGQTNTVGAIVPQGDRTWFYKMTGNRKMVEAQKPVFVQFVKSVQYP